MITLHRSWPARLFVGLCLLSLLALTGCKKDVGGDDGSLYINLPEGKSIAFDDNGGEKTLALKHNVSTLRVAVSQEATSWLSARVTPNALVATALPNEGEASRTDKLTLSGGGLTETVEVTQTGKAPFIQPGAAEYTIDEYGGDLLVEIVANRDFDLVLPSDAGWLTEKSREEGAPVRITLTAEPLAGGERTAVVELRAKDGSVTASFRVLQRANEGYTPQDDIVVPSDIKVMPDSGKASSFHAGEGIENAFDGLFDDNKLYHSDWDNSPADYFPITLEFFFDGSQDLNYLIYYPRQNGPNGRFKEIEVWGKGSEMTEYTRLAVDDLKGSQSPSKVLFEKAVAGATAIKIVVKSGAGDGKGFASAQEIEFYRNNPEKFDLLSIFTDTSASELKPEITEEQIAAIKVPVYQQIAYHLFKGDYPKEFRIDSFRAFPDPDAEKVTNCTSQPLSLFDNPTGIAVREGQDLLVLVGETQGREIGLLLVNYDVPGGDGVNSRKMLPLEEGANLLQMPQAGHLYLAYYADDWETAPNIKVHFASGQVQGYYDSQKHSPAKYAELLSHATASKYFDLVGKYAHLAFPVADFKAVAPTDGKGVADLYDGLVQREFEFLGLFKYDRLFHNRAFFCVHYNPELYLYATAYHTAYTSGVVRDLLQIEGVKSESWGLAHELGHQLQTWPGVKWHGMTEVTNNIMSLYIQTEYGVESRIQSEANGDYVNHYDKAYALFHVEDYSTAYPEGKLFPYLARKSDIYSDVFEMLVPFWQLQLYFAKVKGNEDFYKDLYELARDEHEKDLKLTDGQVQLDFTRKASKAGGADLTRFFEKWGFYRPMDQEVNDYSPKRVVVSTADAEKTKKKIAALSLPAITDKIEYISDNNWKYFRDRTPVSGSGSATRFGQTITIPENAYKGVVAYEVYMGEKLIAVSNNTKIVLPANLTISGDLRLYAVAYDGKQTAIALK